MNLDVYKPNDAVKVCNQNTCIEARGENARAIVGALCFAFVCFGVAALLKTIK